MDESWRMRMGMNSASPRRFTKPSPSPSLDFSRRTSLSETRDPDDFSDVFGGPPQTVLLRKFSNEFAPGSFYDEVFGPPEFSSPAMSLGRKLPAFRIPGSNERSYGDVFRLGRERKSRDRSRPGSKTKSKSNSSSVLSSEELSPLRQVIGDDGALSSFASKLRPINIPSRWNSSSAIYDEYPQKYTPTLPCSPPSSVDNQYMENYCKQKSTSFNNEFSRRVTSPESINIETNSYSFKISADDFEINSPSSVISSVCHESEPMAEPQDHVMAEQETEQDDDESSSSFVIEFNLNHHQQEDNGDSIGIDDAIAWAKESFRAHSDDKKWTLTQHGQVYPGNNKEDAQNEHGFLGADTTKHRTSSSAEEGRNKGIAEGGTRGSEKDVVMELMDEDIMLWSAGKENNIRSLLSTLHHILWPNSGWNPVPLTSLIESSHVKKAYQKARLCLHPDKLQQRGATPPQKYIAQKAFSILQDAWDAFIAKDVLFC